MANYNTDLKSWGSNGSEYPDGYKYGPGKPPVDVWDNFLVSNLIDDVQHLIGLTNERIESDKGSSTPSTPESAHLFSDTDSGDLKWYDSSSSTWSRALDATGDTMEGALTLSAGAQTRADITSDTGTTIYDHSTDSIPADALAGDSVSIDAGAGLTGGGTVSLGGSMTLDVEDGRYVQSGGDTMTGTLTLQDGSKAASRSWVNSNADVPNADYADTAGGAEKVDGWNKTDIQSWVNNNANVPNATHADQADSAITADEASHAESADTFSFTTNSDGLKAGSTASGRPFLAPYDGSSWLYNREISFTVSDNEWTIEGTPKTSNGTIATRSWVNENADVPSADSADVVSGPDGGEHYSGSLPVFNSVSTGLSNTSEGDLFYCSADNSVYLNDGN